VEDLLHDRRFGRLGFEVAAVGVVAVAEGDGAAGPLAAGGLAFHAGDDALDDGRAFELGEHAEHLHHHPARRGGGVERLGRGAEEHCGVVELFQDLGEAADGAGEPVDAVHEQEVEAFRLRFLERALQPGPVEGGAGCLVGEAAGDFPALLAFRVVAEPVGLRFERVGLVVFVGGDAGVGGDPHQAASRCCPSWAGLA